MCLEEVEYSSEMEPPSSRCCQSGLSDVNRDNECGINSKAYCHWQRKLFLMSQRQAQVEFTLVSVLLPDVESSVVNYTMKISL